MYYGNIKNFDIANGPGVRVTLFVSGCTNRCKNCFQPETWDFCYGNPFTLETEELLLTMLRPDYIRGLTLLGGEPFEPENQRALVPFLRRVRQELPNKDIWAFSGSRMEELLGGELTWTSGIPTGSVSDDDRDDGSSIDDPRGVGYYPEGSVIEDGDPRPARTGHVHTEVTMEMLSLLDVLVDGRFVERLRDLSLDFRGSRNQRLIDVPATLNKRQIILWENKTSKRPGTPVT